MTGKQIAATVGLSVLSIFAGIGIALMFLQPKTIIQTASDEGRSSRDSAADETRGKGTSGKKVSREEAEAEIDNALRQSDEDDAKYSIRKYAREDFRKIWRSEIKTLDDFRLSPSAAEALSEYGTFMRKYYACRENRRSRPPMDEQKKHEAKQAMHVVEKTFPLAAMGCQKALAYLFENGISDVNYIGDGGYLHCAVTAARTDMVDFLLKRGADINLPDKDGQTPLGFVRNRDPKIEYLIAWHLVDRGADLFGDPRHGLRPDGLLYLSAKFGDLGRVKKLVEEFRVKPKDAKFFNEMLKDASSGEIKEYLEREANRRNWEETWRERKMEEERKEKEREKEQGKAKPASTHEMTIPGPAEKK